MSKSKKEINTLFEILSYNGKQPKRKDILELFNLIFSETSLKEKNKQVNECLARPGVANFISAINSRIQQYRVAEKIFENKFRIQNDSVSIIGSTNKRSPEVQPS